MNWSKVLSIVGNIIGALFGFAFWLVVAILVIFLVIIALYLYGSVDETTDEPVPMSEVITTPSNIKALTGVDFGAIRIDSAYANEGDFNERKIRGHYKTKPGKAFWAQLLQKAADDPVHWRYDSENHAYSFARSWGFNGMEKPEGIMAKRGTVRIELGEGVDGFMIYEGADWTLGVKDYLPQDLDRDSLSKYFGCGIPKFHLVNYHRNMYRAGLGHLWHYEFVHVIRFNSPKELERLRTQLKEKEAKNKDPRPDNADEVYSMYYSPAIHYTYKLEIPKKGNYADLTYTYHDRENYDKKEITLSDTPADYYDNDWHRLRLFCLVGKDWRPAEECIRHQPGDEAADPARCREHEDR